MNKQTVYRALVDGKVDIQYQPIVGFKLTNTDKGFKTTRIHKLEALLHVPKRIGEKQEFLEIAAEDYPRELDGLVTEIVLRDLDIIRNLNGRRETIVTINPTQGFFDDFKTEFYQDLLKKIIQEKGNIGLEYLESIPKNKRKEHIPYVRYLHDNGIDIIADDCGVEGNSEVSDIECFDFSGIKLDKEIVQNPSLVYKIAQFKNYHNKNNMEKGIVFEGIEDIETLKRHVMNFGENIISAQGYLFSKPLFVNDLEQFYYDNDLLMHASHTIH